VILGDGQDFVTVEGTPWAVLGDAVAPHGITPHAAPVMAEGSSFVRIDGLPACRAGNKATCGHAATGSAFMRISE
jgi:uncharacterized Zn-binding protein involved in type VI secretion